MSRAPSWANIGTAVVGLDDANASVKSMNRLIDSESPFVRLVEDRDDGRAGSQRDAAAAALASTPKSAQARR